MNISNTLAAGIKRATSNSVSCGSLGLAAVAVGAIVLISFIFKYKFP